MSPVFTSRRRAEEFATLVDTAPSDASATASGTRAPHADLLELVAALRDVPAPEARPAFVADLRAELMAAATVRVPAAGSSLDPQTQRLILPPAQRRRDRRVAALVGSLALVGATTSVAVASQGALPGEALYPVKRAIEAVRTDVRPAGGEQGRLMLVHASERLDEVTALSVDGAPADTGAVADTLVSFGDQAREASAVLLVDYAQHGHRGSVTRLRDFDAASLDRLTALESLVPAGAHDEVLAAARTLFDIDAAAQQACPGCGGAGIHEIPGVFAGIASGTAPVVVPSATLRPKARPQQSPAQPPVVTPTAGPAGATVGDATADGGTAPAPTGDPLGSLTGILSGTLTGTLSGDAPLPTASPSPTGVAGLLQQTGDAVQDATKDATGSGLTSGSTSGSLPDVGGTVASTLP